MPIPQEVHPEETLGRGVFSNGAARRAPRRITLNVLLERPTVVELSVDRLDVAPPHEADAATWLDRSAHTSPEVP